MCSVCRQGLESKQEAHYAKKSFCFLDYKSLLLSVDSANAIKRICTPSRTIWGTHFVYKNYVSSVDEELVRKCTYWENISFFVF